MQVSFSSLGKNAILWMSFALCGATATGQISIPAVPLSSRFALKTAIATVQMPTFDLRQVLRDDSVRCAAGSVPAQFGHLFSTSIDVLERGSWDTIATGDRICRLKIKTFGAHTVRLLFDAFWLPEGGALFIYNESKMEVIGALTDHHNTADRQLATTLLSGEAVVVEYNAPPQTVFPATLRIGSVVHGYHDPRKEMAQSAWTKGFGDAGSCNVDVACALGAGWQDEKRAVGLVLVNGNRWCSGSVVNNTAEDGRPYFLTANHCLTGDLSLWTFVFNYESAVCNGGDGSLVQSISGATLRATATAADFALVEMSAAPPSNYGVYYAGWDAGGAAGDSSVAIHHPAGDVKKISRDDDSLATVGLFWRVENWDIGTTEGGSSGSPLFDKNGRVVGQLSGGTASCNAPNGWDEYGKFSGSWAYGVLASQRLAPWLNPLPTAAATQLNGRYFSNLPPFDVALVSIASPLPTVPTCDTAFEIVIRLQNTGDSAIAAFDVVYWLDSLATDTLHWVGWLERWQELSLVLPTVSASAGYHKVNVRLSTPFNDPTLVNNFQHIGCWVGKHEGVSIFITTDGNVHENFYLVLNDKDEVVYSGSQFVKNQFQTANICLADGCYRVVVVDMAGDGIAGGQFGVGIGSDTVGRVTGAFASDTIYFCLPYMLKANFTALKPAFCVGEPVRLQNTSQRAVAYQWQMPNAVPSTSTDAVPVFTYSTAGLHPVHLTVADSNGITADTTIWLTVNAGNLVAVNLLTDAFPEETSYRVVEQATGKEVFGSGVFLKGEALYSQSLCLADGCYALYIADSYGDGLSGWAFGGVGSVEVVAGGQVAGVLSGNFGALDSILFCVSAEVVANFALDAAHYCVGQPIYPRNFSTNAYTWTWQSPTADHIAAANTDTPTIWYSVVGVHALTLTVTDAQGNSDDTTLNITVTAQNLLTVLLRTDLYPAETAYTLRDAANKVVYVSPPFDQPETMYRNDFCLANGCYSLVMRDLGQDGLCCGFGQGGYEVFHADSVLVAMGGAFGAVDSVAFCLQTAATGLPKLPAPTVWVYPNPLTDGWLRYAISPAERIGRIRVFDALGRVVLVFWQPVSPALSLQSLPSGQYWVVFELEKTGKNVVKQILKP